MLQYRAEDFSVYELWYLFMSENMLRTQTFVNFILKTILETILEALTIVSSVLVD